MDLVPFLRFQRANGTNARKHGAYCSRYATSHRPICHTTKRLYRGRNHTNLRRHLYDASTNYLPPFYARRVLREGLPFFPISFFFLSRFRVGEGGGRGSGGSRIAFIMSTSLLLSFISSTTIRYRSYDSSAVSLLQQLHLNQLSITDQINVRSRVPYRPYRGEVTTISSPTFRRRLMRLLNEQTRVFRTLARERGYRSRPLGILNRLRNSPSIGNGLPGIVNLARLLGSLLGRPMIGRVSLNHRRMTLLVPSVVQGKYPTRALKSHVLQCPRG